MNLPARGMGWGGTHHHEDAQIGHRSNTSGKQMHRAGRGLKSVSSLQLELLAWARGAAGLQIPAAARKRSGTLIADHDVMNTKLKPDTVLPGATILSGSPES